MNLLCAHVCGYVNKCLSVELTIVVRNSDSAIKSDLWQQVQKWNQMVKSNVQNILMVNTRKMESERRDTCFYKKQHKECRPIECNMIQAHEWVHSRAVKLYSSPIFLPHQHQKRVNTLKCDLKNGKAKKLLAQIL